MKAVRCLTLLFLAAASGCDEAPLRPESPPVAYQPELAGTVDHALCLLGFAAAPMRGLTTGHQMVDGELNGKPASFVLDTGANVSVVDASHAEAFGLKPQRGVTGAAIGLGGGMNAGRSRIETLRIGSTAIRQDHIMIADLSNLTSLLGSLSGGPIHGIIGQDVMTEHRAVVDVGKPMLYLQAGASAPAPIPAQACAAAPETSG
jgi:hypothetical protein